MSQELACPKHIQALSSILHHFTDFYMACPKSGPVPSIGIDGYWKALPRISLGAALAILLLNSRLAQLWLLLV